MVQVVIDRAWAVPPSPEAPKTLPPFKWTLFTPEPGSTPDASSGSPSVLPPIPMELAWPDSLGGSMAMGALLALMFGLLAGVLNQTVAQHVVAFVALGCAAGAAIGATIHGIVWLTKTHARVLSKYTDVVLMAVAISVGGAVLFGAFRFLLSSASRDACGPDMGTVIDFAILPTMAPNAALAGAANSAFLRPVDSDRSTHN
jgi:hypothetical protein